MSQNIVVAITLFTVVGALMRFEFFKAKLAALEAGRKFRGFYAEVIAEAGRRGGNSSPGFNLPIDIEAGDSYEKKLIIIQYNRWLYIRGGAFIIALLITVYYAVS